MKNEFVCSNCKKIVKTDGNIGTKNRNHCPFCLYSLHVDSKISGDRNSNCSGKMRPRALTFKKEGLDKFGKQKQGELMLVHICLKCDKISINRIASDDDANKLLNIFNESKVLDNDIINKLESENIEVLREKDKSELTNQLFGINHT